MIAVHVSTLADEINLLPSRMTGVNATMVEPRCMAQRQSFLVYV